MRFFLIIYDRKTGSILDQREYGPEDRDEALRARSARELIEKDRPDLEVVVLGAESLEALQKTHSRYFKSFEELSRTPTQ